MQITKLQRSMLEKIWLETQEIPLQLVADTLNIRKHYGDKEVPITDGGNYARELRELLPMSLLRHLLRIRINRTIKTENL